MATRKNTSNCGHSTRAPLFAPKDLPGLEIDTAISCLYVTSSTSLDVIFSAIDDDYRLLLSDIPNGTHHSNYSASLKSEFDSLSTSDGLVCSSFGCCNTYPTTSTCQPLRNKQNYGPSPKPILVLARNGEWHQTTYFPLFSLCSCAIIPTLQSYGHVCTFYTPRISHATCGLGSLFFW